MEQLRCWWRSDYLLLRDFFSNLHELSWELLDNAAYSNLCDCCDSNCKSRWTRSTVSGICTTSAVLNSTHCIALKLFVFSPKTGKHGMVQKAVLGPLTITDWNSWKASVKLYYISILSQQQPHLFFYFSPLQELIHLMDRFLNSKLSFYSWFCKLLKA